MKRIREGLCTALAVLLVAPMAVILLAAEILCALAGWLAARLRSRPSPGEGPADGRPAGKSASCRRKRLGPEPDKGRRLPPCSCRAG